MQVVDALLELFNELQAYAQARELRLELRRQLAEPCRRPGAFLDEVHLVEHPVHARFELRRLAEEYRRALVEGDKRGAVGPASSCARRFA
jgi:hypothetical protein